MAVAFRSQGAAVGFTNAASAILQVGAGSVAGDVLLAGFAFEGVAAGSGPYISGTPQLGWFRLLFQAPSATGAGLEVWGAILGSGSQTTFNFSPNANGVGRMMSYQGSAGAVGNLQPAIESTATAQVTGDNPSCPSIDTLTDDVMAVSFAAMVLTAPGFVWPAGHTEHWDNTRLGVFGTVEGSSGDKLLASPGTLGAVALTATASPAGAKGATATIGVRSHWVPGRVQLLPLLGAGG